jgi:hypothetical protein
VPYRAGHVDKVSGDQVPRDRAPSLMVSAHSGHGHLPQTAVIGCRNGTTGVGLCNTEKLKPCIYGHARSCSPKGWATPAAPPSLAGSGERATAAPGGWRAGHMPWAYSPMIMAAKCKWFPEVPGTPCEYPRYRLLIFQSLSDNSLGRSKEKPCHGYKARISRGAVSCANFAF